MRQLSDSELENISGGGKKTFVICSIGIFSIGLLLKFFYDVYCEIEKIESPWGGMSYLCGRVKRELGYKSSNIYDRAVDYAVDRIVNYAVYEYEKDKESKK